MKQVFTDTQTVKNNNNNKKNLGVVVCVWKSKTEYLGSAVSNKMLYSELPFCMTVWTQFECRVCMSERTGG